MKLLISKLSLVRKKTGQTPLEILRSPKRSRFLTGPPAFSRAGQTATELAIFGTILVFIIGALISYAMIFSYNQQVQMIAFRQALALSMMADVGEAVPEGYRSASVTFIQERDLPNLSNAFGIMQRTPVAASAAAAMNRHLYQKTFFGSQSALPRVKMYVNADEFEFTTADFETVPCNESAGLLYCDNAHTTRLRRKLTRGSKEWGSGYEPFANAWWRWKDIPGGCDTNTFNPDSQDENTLRNLMSDVDCDGKEEQILKLEVCEDNRPAGSCDTDACCLETQAIPGSDPPACTCVKKHVNNFNTLDFQEGELDPSDETQGFLMENPPSEYNVEPGTKLGKLEDNVKTVDIIKVRRQDKITRILQLNSVHTDWSHVIAQTSDGVRTYSGDCVNDGNLKDKTCFDTNTQQLYFRSSMAPLKFRKKEVWITPKVPMPTEGVGGSGGSGGSGGIGGCPCDDGDPCTYGDDCSGGPCQGTPITCTSDICATRTCNGTSSCAVSYNNGAGCNDGDDCTANDVCNNGTCGGAPMDCADNDPCTTDSCSAGSCVHTPDAACTACLVEHSRRLGESCNETGQCCDGGGWCGFSHGTCYVPSSCPPIGCKGRCEVFVPHGACGWCHTIGAQTCSDSRDCPVGTVCGPSSSGCFCNTPCCSNLCIAAVPDQCWNGCSTDPDCNDYNPCTVDYCYSPDCSHNPYTCDDGNPCTVDSCNGDGTCTHDANAGDGTACADDGIWCTSDVCSGGVCTHFDPGWCEDGNPCTTDICNQVGDCVSTNLPDGTSCGDGLTCSGGVCQ